MFANVVCGRVCCCASSLAVVVCSVRFGVLFVFVCCLFCVVVVCWPFVVVWCCFLFVGVR